jgi:hypothetical protein
LGGILRAFTSRSNNASPDGLKDNSDNRYIENIVVLCVHEHGAAGGHRYIENIAISDIVTSRVNCIRDFTVTWCTLDDRAPAISSVKTAIAAHISQLLLSHCIDTRAPSSPTLRTVRREKSMIHMNTDDLGGPGKDSRCSGQMTMQHSGLRNRLPNPYTSLSWLEVS